MKIKRVKFRGFGRWVDSEFQFHEGINLIEAPNEAGKSTLLQGLYGILFGEKKEGLKKRKEADWYESYKPWQSQEYGGEIDYNLQNKEYRLYRNMLIPNTNEQLIDLKTGNDLTSLFAMNRQKDRQFIEKQIGLSGETYRRVGILTSGTWIHSPKKKEEDQTFHQKVLEKMTGLLKNGADADVTHALERLDQQIEAIGKSDFARQKPFGVESEKVRKLEQEIEGLYEVRTQLWQLEGQKNELQQVIESQQKDLDQLEEQRCRLKEKIEEQRELETDLNRLEFIQVSMQRVLGKLDELNHLKQQMEEWLEEKEQLSSVPNIDGEPYQEYKILQKQMKDLKDQLEKLNQDRIDLLDQLAGAKKHKESLRKIDTGRASLLLSKLEDYEMFEGRFVSYSETSEEEEQHKFTQINADLDRLGELQDEQNQLHEKKNIAHQEFLKMKTQYAQKKESALPWLVGTLVTLMIPAGLALYQWLLGICGLVIPILLLIQYIRANKQILSKKKMEQRQKKRMQLVLEDLDKQITENTQSQKLLMQKWRVRNRSELIYRREEIQDQYNASVVNAIERQNLDEQLKMMQQEIDVWLGKHIRSLPAFHVADRREKIQNMQTQVQRAEDQFRMLTLKLEALDKEIEKRSAEQGQIELNLVKYHKEFGTEDSEQIEQWYQQRKHIEQLDWQLENVKQQIDKMEQLSRREAWIEQLSNLLAQRGEVLRRWKGVNNPIEDRHRDWEYEFVQLESKLADLETAKQKNQMEWFRMDQTLENLEGELSRLHQLESELEVSRQKVKEMKRERDALELARSCLQKAANQYQEDLAPRLSPYASEWIRTITQNRYDSLYIDPKDGIQLSVFVPETGERKAIEHLSTGTIDQMYLALRFALLQFYSDMTKTQLPLILDDCFVHFDPDRLAEALRLLGDFSKKHQVILCTCQTREREYLDLQGIPYHSMTLTSSLHKNPV